MEQVIEYITMAISIASIICAATPTPKDNAILHTIYRAIEMIALNVGKAKH
mgnify:CR=1|tara:strand:+ start:1385 stop:1537 length:153 start_codon:yes stop_codon:yes gene_type:complete